MEYCNLSDKDIKIAVMKKFNKYKKTQEDYQINSGVKLMNRRNYLLKILKF